MRKRGNEIQIDVVSSSQNNRQIPSPDFSIGLIQDSCRPDSAVRVDRHLVRVQSLPASTMGIHVKGSDGRVPVGNLVGAHLLRAGPLQVACDYHFHIRLLLQSGCADYRLFHRSLRM